MQTFILRCKHCHTEYHYNTYGYGNDGCTMELCPECAKAVDKALSKISVKFEDRPYDIDEPMLFPLFEQIKSKIEEKRNNGDSPFPVCVCLNDFPLGNYDEGEVYVHNHKKYLVRWYDDNPDKKYVSIMMEYDIKNKKFTGKIWKYDGGDTYHSQRNYLKHMTTRLYELSQTPPQEMAQPKGDLFFMDVPYNWDVVTKHKDLPPKQHILKTHTWECDGMVIKARVGRGDLRVVNGIDVSKLVDFVDYQYTTEEYEDEGVRTIIKIDCI